MTAAAVGAARAAWHEAANKIGEHIEACPTCSQKPLVRCEASKALWSEEAVAWDALSAARGWGATP